jgi:hypothetical protein
MNGGGTHGFVPTFAQGAESVVKIAIFDLATTPDKQLVTVEVTVGGDPVKSETSAVFSLRVLDVKPQYSRAASNTNDLGTPAERVE